MNDSAPLAFLHPRNELAGETHATGEIQFNDPIPGFVGDFINRLGVIGACVVHKDIDFAEALYRFVRECFNLGAINHVCDHPLDFDIETPGDLCCCGFEFVLVTAGDHDIRTSFCESACHGFAKPFAAASDECGATFEGEKCVE